MITSALSRIASEPIFFECPNFLQHGKVYLKIEGLNLAGSIKLKTALHLIAGLEKKHGIIPAKHNIIESSSGNLGVALSLVCKEKGYHFTCVTDPNISLSNEKLIKLYGAELIKVTERDEVGGYLGTRIKYIKNILSQNKSYVWTNQYENQDNVNAHYQETALEIVREFPRIDYLFIGAGTTGTLVGCGKYFKLHSPNTKIIAVDSVGSVTFDFPASKRFIPGLGTSRKPEIVDRSYIDDVILVHEKQGINMCHHLLERYGLLMGGSTGSVMSAIKNYSYEITHPRVIAIAPDFGHKYIETIYDQNWVDTTFA